MSPEPKTAQQQGAHTMRKLLPLVFVAFITLVAMGAPVNAQTLIDDVPTLTVEESQWLESHKLVIRDIAEVPYLPLDKSMLKYQQCIDATAAIIGNRWQVEVEWEDFSGNTGVGCVQILLDGTVTFWFFGSQNMDLAVKIINACDFNDRAWVFAGSLSNVLYTLRVTDLWTGQVREYLNPKGQFGSFGDTDAFATCGVPEPAPVANGANICVIYGGSGMVNIEQLTSEPANDCVIELIDNPDDPNYDGPYLGTASVVNAGVDVEYEAVTDQSATLDIFAFRIRNVTTNLASNVAKVGIAYGETCDN